MTQVTTTTKHKLNLGRASLRDGASLIASQVEKERIKNKGIVRGVCTTLDYKSKNHDQIVGLYFGDGVHYLDQNFRTEDQLASILLNLGVEVSASNRWGMGSNRDTYFDASIQPVNTKQKSAFNHLGGIDYIIDPDSKPYALDSGFFDSAAWFDKENGRLEWSIEALQEKFPQLVPSTLVVENSSEDVVEVVINSGVSFCVAGTNLAGFKAEFDALVNKYLI